MKSLTGQAHNWWRTVYKQREATGSLFQPVTGKIPVMFTRLSGPEVNVQGIFYACGASTQEFYLDSSDIPNPEYMGKEQGDARYGSCLVKFPNSTTTRPSFWID